MPDKLVVGPFNRGLRNDVTPFNVDNESFPVLVNAYQWRGRVKRKRGTSLIGRLKRYIGTTDGAGNIDVIISPQPILTGRVSFVIGTDVFYDPGTTADPADQILITNGSATVHTLNRVTGRLIITGSQANKCVIYYPTLPVMGLEDIVLDSTQYPGTLAFDTTYSYRILTVFPYDIYDVSFYKNPAASALLPFYIPKGTWTPTWWNGENYQQFWTVSYQGALWATNGIKVPFDPTSIGMQFKTISNLVIFAVGPPAILVFTIANHGLVVGDFIFVNEVNGITGINYQTGYVTTVFGPNTFAATFPNATIGGAYINGGIAQYLTNRSDTTKDVLRWFDGDPVDGACPPAFTQGHGWVNFMPPLNNLTLFQNFSIADLPPAQYYLVGARMIVPFKDRLLFFGPVIQTSSGSPIYLQDTVVYSQNGTPYYTSSFTGDPSLATTVQNPILVPDNQTASATAYWEDLTGFGGFLTAGVQQPIITVNPNEDVLVVGFNTIQTKLVYTGNDLVPFNFYTVNSEFGSSSTFSAVNTDTGVISRGSRGFVLTGQTQCSRFDLEIPDEVFEIKLIDNGAERFCSQRDYENEWIYFTYPNNEFTYVFPSQTLLYNYRDNSWAVFFETYTTYGSFRKQTGFTWATVGTVYSTWKSWNAAWNSGASTLLEPDVIAGNQQGFVLVREDEDTSEDNSLVIQNIVSNTVTSPDHCLSNDDYIYITGVLGDIGTLVNGKIFSVYSRTDDSFKLSPAIGSGTYLGGGLITRSYVPFIQSKQFPVAWDMGRKTRIGVQKYLLSSTSRSQIQLLIYLSQDANNPYNSPPIIPDVGVLNNSLIYDTVLYTCTESSNLGLTPANTNLQMISYINPAGDDAFTPQSQIWHRVNTSLIGDTVQVGFTISDKQMRELLQEGPSFVITGVSQANPAVILTDAQFAPGTVIKIQNVVGMTELNFTDFSNNTYVVIDSTSTDVTIGVDSTAFTPYVSGGIIYAVANFNSEAEVELHGMVIEVSQSQMLS